MTQGFNIHQNGVNTPGYCDDIKVASIGNPARYVSVLYLNDMLGIGVFHCICVVFTDITRPTGSRVESAPHVSVNLKLMT